MTLGKKLVTSFLGCGLIPVGIVAYVSYTTADKGMDTISSQGGGALEKTAYNQLIALRDVKKRQIETYFAERKGDMGVLVENVGTLRNEAFNKLIAVREIKKNQIESYFKNRLGLLTDVQMNLRFTKGTPAFTEAFAQGLQSEAYKQTYEQRFAGLNVFCEIFGFYDVFLIDPQGNVVFTVAKEADWGTNLVSGPLKESGLAEAFERGKSATTFVDFAWYGPSKEPASFVSTPLRDDSGQLVGVAAFQVSLKEINAIMQERAGLGETGESYLIGPDKLMRSDSFLDPENHSVVASFNNPSKGSVDTDAARAVLAGASAAKVIMDYNGNPVLSAYTPVEVGGVTWGLLTEIDVAEAFCPKDAQGEYFYKKYAEMYGYYDLFLINPDGYCFYTVAQEADYQTNLVNGKYSSSNLGKLTRQVLANKSFGFADFEPYAPSNGTPAAFIAQPVIFDGKTEIIVALQLPLDAINSIMGVRAGMGETGETYLVGPDKLMRSDSFLDPTNHTVATSFKNPASGSVDTDAAKAALGGATDAKLITDYNGNSVLSAYAPIDVFGTRWALLAEIDESEALAAVVSMNSTAAAAGTKLLTWIGVLSAVAAALVLVFAIYLARSISKPINRVIIGLNDGADQVTDAANQVSMSSQQLAEGASEQASSVEETSSSLEEMAAMTRTNAEHSKKASDLAAQAHKNAEEGDKTMGQLNTAITAIDESSAKISKIIKVIEEIAFQTNLLALNAAVEAARAGEHGKGFAVVAEEVRNLAQRSAAAARDTTGLIEDSVNRAKEGTTVAASATKALRSIVSDVTEVASLLSGITQASGEQAQGVEQINGAVSQIDSTTQANAASAEECAAAAEELNAQAVNVKSMVDELAQVIGGGASREARPAPQQAPRSRSKGKTPETPPVASDPHPGNAHNLFKEKDLDQNQPADAPAMQEF